MRFATLILIIALGAAACGGPGKTAATPTTAYVAKLRAYAKCMRAHGVEMPDPQVDSNGGVHMGVGVRGNKSKAEVEAAVKSAKDACESLQPTDEDRANAFATQIAKLRDLAKCMRAHGVTKFPDPAADGAISLSKAGVDRNGSVYKAADKACSQYRPESGR
jgi:hypothetical protein